MLFRKNNNDDVRLILINMLVAAVSLFINGFGVYLTIQANIGAGPWDVLNLGLSKSLGILYGTASIAVSYGILGIDILMKEPIGVAMFIDAFVVGKSVDLFNRLNLVSSEHSMVAGIAIMFLGLVIMAYTQFAYMAAALGCGPRDTLLVALTKRLSKYKLPIGVISVGLLSLATFVGWLLGGPVGVGTIICAFCTGPIMQLAFKTVKFDAAEIRHQPLLETLRKFKNYKSKTA